MQSSEEVVVMDDSDVSDPEDPTSSFSKVGYDIHIFIFIYICVYMYICIYIERE
jgi:hypothetical protein